MSKSARLSAPLSAPLSAHLSDVFWGYGVVNEPTALSLPGTADNYLITDETDFVTQGRLAVEIHADMDTWQLGTHTLLCLNGNDLRLTITDGQIFFYRVSFSINSTTIPDGTVAIKVFHNFDNTGGTYEVTYYYSLTGADGSFTQFGSTGTISSSPQPQTTPLYLGAQDPVTGNSKGLIHKLYIRDTLAGPPIFGIDFDNIPAGSDYFPSETGQHITLHSSGIPPAEIIALP